MILIAPAPGVPVVVIRTVVALVCTGPVASVEIPPCMCARPTDVAPEVMVELAAAKRAAVVPSPTDQFVAVVIVVVTRATTQSMIEFAGRRFAAVFVVVPLVESVRL